MNDQLLAMTAQEFQQIYQEVEFKLEKLHNKNNVIQQNLDVDIVKRELYQMIKSEIDQLQYFIEEIKDQMKQLENNINNIDSKNKIKRLKDNYLKETQRTKAITRMLNNKSSFQSEKQYQEVSILTQSDTGGQPDSEPFNQQEGYQQYDQKIQEYDQYQNGTTIQNQDSPSNSMLQELKIQDNSNTTIQNNNNYQEREEDVEVQEDINKQVYLIVLVILLTIVALIIWLLYDEDIL